MFNLDTHELHIGLENHLEMNPEVRMWEKGLHTFFPVLCEKIQESSTENFRNRTEKSDCMVSKIEILGQLAHRSQLANNNPTLLSERDVTRKNKSIPNVTKFSPCLTYSLDRNLLLSR